MSDVEFEDVHSIERPSIKLAEQVTLLSRIVMKLGLAKTAEQAQKIILTTALAFGALAIVIFLYAMSF